MSIPPMVHTAYKITTTTNDYGDRIAGAQVAIKCHFRHITQHVYENNETVQCDAMAWFEPDSGIVRNTLIKFEGEHFRVEKVIKARRLHNPNVVFIKTELLKYGTIS